MSSCLVHKLKNGLQKVTNLRLSKILVKVTATEEAQIMRYEPKKRIIMKENQ